MLEPFIASFVASKVFLPVTDCTSAKTMSAVVDTVAQEASPLKNLVASPIAGAGTSP